MQFSGGHKICQRCFNILHRASFRSSAVQRKARWSSKEVRRSFLDFFCNKYDHKFVPSMSVIPKKGEGTYFTNAGMNQFKPIFLGTIPIGSELENYKRVANSQKCIRVGGKHNDLDDVGQDLTHHTFFEMMGSWSFGDYFKKEACAMALKLLTEVYKLPLDRLYFTYFGGNQDLGLAADEECRDIWRQLGIPASHVLPFGMKDNFWDMGEIGPCGPCTEIHYDHLGNRDASSLVNMGVPDVVEVWNLVFMQFERQPDQTLTRLPRQHVDTGMGLERMCAVLQGTMSNYDTDLFAPLFHWLHKTTGAPPYSGKVGLADTNKHDTAYRIIADHTRMSTVCIADGLLPARVGIEQKLRLLMHRSFQQYENILHGPPGQLAGLVPLVAESLGEAYPEISSNLEKIQEVVGQTEHKYRSMIAAGKKQFSKFLKQYGNITVLSGDHIKALHEGRFGTPMSLDTIEDIAEVHGIALDLDDFHQLISQEKMIPVLEQHNIEPAQLSQTFISGLHNAGVSQTDDMYKYSYERTRDGYSFDSQKATVLAIICDSNVVSEVKVNDEVTMILDKTQFYSEAGGQDGDKGVIELDTGTVEIYDTQSSHGYVLHHGVVTKGTVAKHQKATLTIDTDHRLCCMRNHTATHLLNAALRTVIGDVKQRGSSVGPDRFTFDFACIKSVKNDDIRRVEELVCHTVSRGLTVDRNTLPLHDAMSIDGIVSLENEAYPSEVHVISVVDNSDTQNVCQSTELCGGTHIHNTADIGSFCVSNFSGVTQGIKRMVCLTGPQARQAIEAGEKLKSLYERLAVAVRTCSDPDHWADWRNEINGMITEEFLPKTVRDDVKENMTLLGTEVSMQQNKLHLVSLKKDITSCMMDINTDYVIRQTNMKTLKNATAMLEKLDVVKPVILVVDYTKGTGILISTPKGCEELKTTLCQELETDSVIRDSKTVTVIRAKKKQTQIAIDTCERILNDFMKERVENC